MTTQEQAAANWAQRPQFTGCIANLMVDGAQSAIDFYVRAFGAQEVSRHASEESGKIMHAFLMINGGPLFINDAFPEYGHPAQAPQGFVLHLQCDDVRAAWDRAIAAGAEVVMPLDVQFWGDRYGQVKDPYGVTWSLGGAP